MNSMLRAVYWFIAGGAIGFGVIAILSIGAPFLLAGLLLVVIGVLRLGARELWAALLGGGVVPLGFLMYDLSQPIEPATTAQTYQVLAFSLGQSLPLGCSGG